MPRILVAAGLVAFTLIVCLVPTTRGFFALKTKVFDFEKTLLPQKYSTAPHYRVLPRAMPLHTLQMEQNISAQSDFWLLSVVGCTAVVYRLAVMASAGSSGATFRKTRLLRTAGRASAYVSSAAQ